MKRIGLFIGGAFLAGVLCLTFRAGTTPPIPGSRSIAVLKQVELGGAPQWILIRGNDSAKPVLLWLHGGPGTPIMPVAHVFGAELERHFVVVHWDQRGSGKSSSVQVPDESFSISQFLADTHQLIEWLRRRMNVERIYLLGHSWGSVLGVLAAQRYPELLYAYVGMAQVTDESRSEAIGLEYVRDRARQLGNQEALRELAGLKPPYLENPMQAAIQRKWLSRFGGNFRRGTPVPFLSDIDLEWAFTAMRSPEYSWLDLIRYLRAYPRVRWGLFHEFKQVNLMESVPKLDLPVYFLMGRLDHNKHPALVEEYFQLLEAPRGKKLIWFEESAHAPCLEEPNRFVEVMVSTVLGETLAAQQDAARMADHSERDGE